MPLNNKQQYICPSVICFDFLHLSQQYEILKKNNVNFLHIDVMDGSFVNQITIGSDFIKQTKNYYKNFFADIHLMIVNPISKIEDFANAGANSITFHYESCNSIKECIETIEKIKKFNIKAGLSIKPNTSIDRIKEIILKTEIDAILVMSVEPGLSGQKFIENTVEKIKQLNNFLIDKKLRDKIKIEIDGGINLDIINQLKKFNNKDTNFIDLFVIGSALHKNSETNNLIDTKNQTIQNSIEYRNIILEKNIRKFNEILK